MPESPPPEDPPELLLPEEPLPELLLSVVRPESLVELLVSDEEDAEEVPPGYCAAASLTLLRSLEAIADCMAARAAESLVLVPT